LLEILEKRNFGPVWISWIKQITHMGSVGVKINGIEGDFFITGKGLRQGDPMSPLLFNLVVDVLSRMLFKAASNSLISGLCSDLIPNGVICLQYADDTILFMDKDEQKAKNLKMVLTCFEKVSGMKINYSKSEIIPIEMSPEETNIFADIMGYKVGDFSHKIFRHPITL
jgi:hypothetical protein